MTLLLLDVECPRCGKSPNLRVTQILVDMAKAVDANHVVGTWGCQRKGCAEKVQITAGMIQRAKAPSLTRR